MTLSLPNAEQENFINAVFKNIISMFEKGSKKIANKLIIELIHTLKSQNHKIMTIREDIYKDKQTAMQYDSEEFYDSMLEVQDSIEKLYKQTKEIKDKSEILSELHDTVDELYTNVLQLYYEVGSTAALIHHEKEKADKIAS